MSSPIRRRWVDHPLVQLTLVRYREFYREPEAVFWVFVFPLLLAAGLGLAFRNRSAEPTPIGIVDTPAAPLLAAALQRRPELKVSLLGDSAANEALYAGRVALVLAPGADGRVEYRYDADRPEGRSARLLTDDLLQRTAGRQDPVVVRDRLVREPGARYIDFVVPGLLGMNLMGSGIWGIGFAIVDARRKRLLKRLTATPMSRTHYLASFLLSRLTWLVLEVALLLGFAALAFGVPTRGAVLGLVVLCVLSALMFGAIGLLIASRAQTVEGVSGLMNLAMLPMWIFSGVFFSASRFPDAVQPLIQALPLTAVVDALRLHLLQGAGWGELLPELTVIGTWLVVSFAAAMRLFRWR